MESKKTHYSFVWDEDQINRYEKEVMGYAPNKSSTNVSSCFLICMGVRKKYCEQVNMKKPFFKRQLYHTSSPMTLVDIMRTYEIPLGTYKDDQGQAIPPEAIVLYASVNPRDTRKAAKALGAFILEEFYKGTTYFTLDSKFKSEVQKSSSTKTFITVDLDLKELLVPIRAELATLNFPDPKFTIETRGGYHLLYDQKTLDGKQKEFLFRTLEKRDKIDVMGDVLCPVPGTIQGGFPVTFVN